MSEMWKVDAKLQPYSKTRSSLFQLWLRRENIRRRIPCSDGFIAETHKIIGVRKRQEKVTVTVRCEKCPQRAKRNYDTIMRRYSPLFYFAKNFERFIIKEYERSLSLQKTQG